MTMMKTGDYLSYNKMPVYAVNAILDWKLKYEEQRKKITEEEARKNEAEMRKRG